ncbi:four helix bundle protein [Bythopirellula goksoeyrii]|uniref:Four helix bundle protein n=1 Tax=Bythopirellula goksoeyrii TaxID=1400387 RepID=A0A5B9QPG4_9BACT|nr:four helix bundle protein [Bythopirellula goksoeyrii]QEG35873.1 hypothetical protein Pr1d_31790 [Bythopirellula goksoeyrii]
MFTFEKLDVWTKSIELTDVIYQVIENLPHDEMYGLSSHLYEAVVSIPTNIAVGCERVTNNDFAHFVSVAYGSLMKTISLLEVVRRRDLVSLTTFATVYALCEELARMLSDLSSSLEKRSKSIPPKISTPNTSLC